MGLFFSSRNSRIRLAGSSVRHGRDGVKLLQQVVRHSNSARTPHRLALPYSNVHQQRRMRPARCAWPGNASLVLDTLANRFPGSHSINSDRGFSRRCIHSSLKLRSQPIRPDHPSYPRFEFLFLFFWPSASILGTKKGKQVGSYPSLNIFQLCSLRKESSRPLSVSLALFYQRPSDFIAVFEFLQIPLFLSETRSTVSN